jgi:hypothetical protein
LNNQHEFQGDEREKKKKKKKVPSTTNHPTTAVMCRPTRKKTPSNPMSQRKGIFYRYETPFEDRGHFPHVCQPRFYLNNIYNYY